MINIIVKYTPDGNEANELRALLCMVARKPPTIGGSPLTETNFNELLDQVAQQAFDDGRRFNESHPDQL